MEKTAKDLKKIGTTTLSLAKKAVYYGFIPTIIILGVRTIDFRNFVQWWAMWFV